MLRCTYRTIPSLKRSIELSPNRACFSNVCRSWKQILRRSNRRSLSVWVSRCSTRLVTLTGENGKSFRARESEIMGAWFYEKRFNARMYYMPTMILTLNPEKHERFITDFAAVKKMLNSMEGLASYRSRQTIK